MSNYPQYPLSKHNNQISNFYNYTSHVEVNKFNKMILMVVLLISMISTVNASIVVKEKEIVAKKGEDVELVCSSSNYEALGC